MSLQLKSIAFNHPAAANVKFTIDIRRNRTQSVQVPEWLNTPEEVRADPAVYVIERIRRDVRNLTLSVSLVSTDASIQAATIRAVSQHISPRDFLGNVVAKRVRFPEAGVPVTVNFNLTNSQLLALGVNMYNVVWDWQFSLTGNAHDFQAFDTSRHKIYAVLATPTLPWTQNSDDDQLPWTEVLDWACAWAEGAHDLDEAATRVTQSVYNLGRILVDIDGLGRLTPLFEYDCPGGGGHHYIDPGIFHCGRFLMRLNRAPSDGPFVNCDDCAAIVSTFANVLGCNLAQVMMGPAEGAFNLNPAILIGALPGDWKVGCPVTVPSFSHHTVAWKGATTWRGEVYDACLMVDGDSNPGGPPSSRHVELLPTNIRFGRVTDRGYRFRLASGPRANLEKCTPMRTDRKRVV